MNSSVFWDVTPCGLLETASVLEDFAAIIIFPEGGSTRFL